jgi:hypothetical protein
MPWGDPNSRAVRAVERRAMRGVSSRARRRAEQRAEVQQTLTRRAAERRHANSWGERTHRGFMWLFR